MRDIIPDGPGPAHRGSGHGAAADQADQGQPQHRAADRDADPQDDYDLVVTSAGRPLRPLVDQVLQLAWQPPRLG
ncbi:MAG TPA: hypothetical protein VES93_10750 [Ornithinibacter sp.]|nr:hypothetical protein [Ornithinibacter sp.]